ncbi:MAG: potassium-transporting ATPase subunit F [Actinobacteria bacterium]|nr:potassium-transporting ATPase subunit F [Actinomycetota bacterium]
MSALLCSPVAPILAIQWQDGVGLVLAVVAVAYLIVVLIAPEKF